MSHFHSSFVFPYLGYFHTLLTSVSIRESEFFYPKQSELPPNLSLISGAASFQEFSQQQPVAKGAGPAKANENHTVPGKQLIPDIAMFHVRSPHELPVLARVILLGERVLLVLESFDQAPCWCEVLPHGVLALDGDVEAIGPDGIAVGRSVDMKHFESFTRGLGCSLRPTFLSCGFPEGPEYVHSVFCF